MSKHTPGPWIAMQDPNAMLGDDWVIGRPCGKPDEVAVCSKKDAHLIASAPDLLDALNQAHMALIGYLPNHRNDVIASAISVARNAIAKATGETP